jgi:hypothetical protein
MEKVRIKWKERARLKAYIKIEKYDNNIDAKNFSLDTKDETFRAFIQLVTYKTLMLSWIINTNAFIHMINQLSLFKRLLRRVKERVVHNARDFKLQIKRAENVKIYMKEGVMRLLNVLYVLNLDVNLLFRTSLYNIGLIRSFNKKALYI